MLANNFSSRDELESLLAKNNTHLYGANNMNTYDVEWPSFLLRHFGTPNAVRLLSSLHGNIKSVHEIYRTIQESAPYFIEHTPDIGVYELWIDLIGYLVKQSKYASQATVCRHECITQLLTCCRLSPLDTFVLTYCEQSFRDVHEQTRHMSWFHRHIRTWYTRDETRSVRIVRTHDLFRILCETRHLGQVFCLPDQHTTWCFGTEWSHFDTSYVAPYHNSSEDRLDTFQEQAQALNELMLLHTQSPYDINMCCADAHDKDEDCLSPRLNDKCLLKVGWIGSTETVDGQWHAQRPSHAPSKIQYKRALQRWTYFWRIDKRDQGNRIQFREALRLCVHRAFMVKFGMTTTILLLPVLWNVILDYLLDLDDLWLLCFTMEKCANPQRCYPLFDLDL